MKAKRNEPCPCGSGLKYKKCHGVVDAEFSKVKRTYSVGEPGADPMIALAQKIMKIHESPDVERPLNLPPSKASTKEAENPELIPPSKYTPEGKSE